MIEAECITGSYALALSSLLYYSSLLEHLSFRINASEGILTMSLLLSWWQMLTPISNSWLVTLSVVMRWIPCWINCSLPQFNTQHSSSFSAILGFKSEISLGKNDWNFTNKIPTLKIQSRFGWLPGTWAQYVQFTSLCSCNRLRYWIFTCCSRTHLHQEIKESEIS